jgi:beta-lactamase regulating signal transducer with metallopeptidase domain
MADFLLLLGKFNLALGAAIIVVYLLRRPLRALFGASIAYGIWVLVPMAGLAILLPPRVVARPAPAIAQFAPISPMRETPHSAGHITVQLTGHGAFIHPLIAARDAAPAFPMPDYATLLFVAWILGVVVVVLTMARAQLRFHAAARLGEAGPAVVGFFRPRIVIPDSFKDQFTAREQAAILAHEGVHLARQDARINALAALLRCLCWFNPLIHLAAASLRMDQELACDAMAVAGLVPRRDYANALVKSQMIAAALPLGCNWPGSQHPLIERIALLKRKRPGMARRITGMSLVMLAATSAGFAAWAAQPPTTKFIVGPSPKNQIARAVPSTTAPNQDPADGSPNLPASSASPTRAAEAVSRVTRLLHARTLMLPPPDFLASFKETQLKPQLIAANDPAPTPPQPASDVAPAPAEQPVAALPTCTLPKIVDTARLDPIPGTDLMTVPVAINGATKQFLLDLAIKKPTEVSEATMAKLGLPEDPKHTETLYYGNGRSSNSYGPGYLGMQVPVYDVRDHLGVGALDTRVRVGSFGIGDATDHNLQLMVAKKGEIGRSDPYDGFLTGDFFKQYDVELDFSRKQMTWLTPTKCTDPDQVVFWSHKEVAVIPVSLASDGRLQMQAMVKGHLINAEIDTSSPHTVMRRDVAELYVGVADKDMLPVGDLEDAMNMQVYVSTFPEVIFAGGGITAKNVPVLIQDFGMHHVFDQAMLGTRALFMNPRIPDLTIGMDVLQHLHMYVVPGQGRVYVTAAD